jgi:EmrB/QacA subfamily drug resistance transporter
MHESGPAKHPNEVLAVLLLAGTAFALSQTLVIPALPQIAADVNASPTAASWILTGFLLSASIATPIVGKLGDVYGKGRVLTAVLVLFSIGGAVNALASSVEVMIAGRVIQGVAGGVFPLAFGIIRDTFPPAKVAGGLAIVSAIFGIGGGIGLPLSGVIVDNLDISWLFWISLVALPAAFASYKLIPSSPPARRMRIDWLGAALLSVALAALLLGVTNANEWGWESAPTIGLLAGGIAMVVVWVQVEARRREPLIELRVLRSRAVAATNLTAMLVGFAMFGSFLMIPQFAQAPDATGYGFGYTATAAGLLIAPTALAQLIAGPVAGRIGSRIGFRLTLAIGAGLATTSFAVLAFEHTHPWEFVVAGILLGAGISFAFASMANLIVGAVPQHEVGIATGINTIMRTVGGAFGAAVSTAILAADTIGSTHVPAEGAYTAAFAMAIGVGLLAVGAALLIPREVARSSHSAAGPVAAPAGSRP